MKELHLTKKDFKVEWFSGQGGGGQHRNKHQNCCRITHIETNISAIGTASKHRSYNQNDAFKVLAARLLAYYEPDRVRGTDGEKVRTYHKERNSVLDHASGFEMRYSEVVGKNNITPMIEARREAKR